MTAAGTEPPLRWRISAETKRCRIDPTGPTMREPFRSRLLTAAKRSLRKRASRFPFRLSRPVRMAQDRRPVRRIRRIGPVRRIATALSGPSGADVSAPTSAPTRKLTPTFSLPGSGLLIGAGPGPQAPFGARPRAQPASVGPDPESPPARVMARDADRQPGHWLPEDPRSLTHDELPSHWGSGVDPPGPAAMAHVSRPPESGLQGRRHPAAVSHSLPRRLAVANQKGGVGKTTTAVNLGAALAELDYRVLVVDLDPQGNATTGLGINGRNLDASVYDVMLHDVPVEDVIEPTSIRNLFGVPATIDLAGAEIELVPAFSRELRLRRALEMVEADFDFVFIDCPPSLGLLTVNGLAAAGEVVVPIQCEYYALEGLGQLLRNVNLVQANLNQGLELSTIILTMYDARTRLAAQVVEEVRQHFGDKVCLNVVPRSVRLSEAPSFGQPITVFDPASRGAIAVYRDSPRR